MDSSLNSENKCLTTIAVRPIIDSKTIISNISLLIQILEQFEGFEQEMKVFFIDSLPS